MLNATYDGNKAIDSSSFASPFSSISLIFADKVMDVVATSMTAGGTSQIAIDVELQRYRDQRTSLTIGRHPRWSEYSPSHSLGQLLSASFALGIGLIMGTINCKFCDLGRNHNTQYPWKFLGLAYFKIPPISVSVVHSFSTASSPSRHSNKCKTC